MRVPRRWRNVRLLVLLYALVAAACSGTSVAPKPVNPAFTSPSAGAWDQVVAAAKTEGQVVVSAFNAGQAVDLQNDAFEKRYGIKVVSTYQRAQEFRARWDAERAAGKPSMDVRMGGSADSRALAAEKLDAPFGDLPELGAPNVTWLYDPLLDVKNGDGYSLHYAIGFMVLVVNNALVPPSIGPTTYKELADPKYRGLILLDQPVPPGPGSRWAAYGYAAYGPDYVRSVISNVKALSTNTNEAPKQVARGEYGIYVHTQVNTLTDLFDLPKPWPFRLVLPDDGQMATTNAASLLQGAPHPNAAKVFMNYLLSREYEQIGANFPGTVPLRSDVKPVQSDVTAFKGKFFPGNPDSFQSARKDYFELAAKAEPYLREFGLK